MSLKPFWEVNKTVGIKLANSLLNPQKESEHKKGLSSCTAGEFGAVW